MLFLATSRDSIVIGNVIQGGPAGVILGIDIDVMRKQQSQRILSSVCRCQM